MRRLTWESQWLARRWLEAALSSLLAVIAVAGCVDAVSLSDWVHVVLSERHNVAYRVPDTDAQVLNRAVVGYLRGGASESLVGHFAADEIRHLRDVRQLFVIERGVVMVASLLLVGSTSWWLARPEHRARGSRSSLLGGIVGRSGSLTVLVGAAAAVGCSFSFAWLFEEIHFGLFLAGTYTFNAGSSRLVALFPETYFRDLAILVIGAHLVLGLGMVLLGRTLQSRR